MAQPQARASRCARPGSEDELRAALELRRLVFVAEQGIDAAEEDDGRDGEAVHLLALSGRAVIRTCRLLESEDGHLKLGRMAVADASAGGASPRHAARGRDPRPRQRARTIALHAQTYACALYRAAGYRVVGEAFWRPVWSTSRWSSSLPEVRVDPLTGTRTIIAAERATRPGGWLSSEPPAPIDPESDPFAPGHEDRTPPEVDAIRPDGGPRHSGGWTVRVVPNLYPALDPFSQPPPPDAQPELFGARAATGAHEVIINGPQSVTSLADLPVEQVCAAAEVWRSRMQVHSQAACVQLIVNERHEAGASLPHTHAQLYALDFVPEAVARERERFSAHAVRTMGSNLLADLVQEEVRRRERVVAIDDEAVLMAPYASRLPFQLMLAPRGRAPASRTRVRPARGCCTTACGDSQRAWAPLRH